jgi:hypothetical protein
METMSAMPAGELYRSKTRLVLDLIDVGTLEAAMIGWAGAAHDGLPADPAGYSG